METKVGENGKSIPATPLACFLMDNPLLQADCGTHLPYWETCDLAGRAWVQNMTTKITHTHAILFTFQYIFFSKITVYQLILIPLKH